MLRLQEGLNKKKAHMEKSIQVGLSLRLSLPRQTLPESLSYSSRCAFFKINDAHPVGAAAAQRRTWHSF